VSDIILETYRAHCESGLVSEDQAQLGVIQHLDQLRYALDERYEGAGRRLWFRAKKRPGIKGVYIWGSVGRGKTYLMDLFYEALTRPDKTRIHFYRFMQSVHKALTELQGTPNPLQQVAKRFAQEAKVLCFDEFFVSDITDAMLLSGLLHALEAEGVTLIATSNVPPSLLYRDGLQRSKFLPAIDLLERVNKVINLDHDSDYRLRALGQAKLFHFPLNDAAEASLLEIWQRLSDPTGTDQSGLVEINGRHLPVRKVSQHLIWFDFDAICGGPRSPSDYIEIAGEYATVFVSGVPELNSKLDNEARRFVSLVDEFYDRRVNLVLSAQVGILELYRGKRLTFEFERTASRLQEMQSHEYFQSPHLS